MQLIDFIVYLAERAGFEPALGYHPKHAFQACDLNHSSTSPWKGRNSNGFGRGGEAPCVWAGTRGR